VNNLVKRSLTGMAYVAIMLGGVLLHPFVFVAVFAIVLFLTQYEFYSLIQKEDQRPNKILSCILGVILFLICFCIASGFLPGRISLIVFLFFISLMIISVFKSNTNALKSLASEIFGFIYVAVPFSLMNFIVQPSANEHSNIYYPWILAGVFFIIWVNDSAAYLTGSALGKHKMCPKISPKKSWEGLIGGAVFATIMGVLNAVMFQQISMVSWIVIALLTVVFGTLGDLFESKIKRELGIKDSGTILPGHGGFLDRLDSLLFAVPVVFIWLMFSAIF
jgi:phosphatidate cytidylyltransferase